MSDVDYSDYVSEIVNLFLPPLAPSEQMERAQDHVERVLHNFHVTVKSDTDAANRRIKDLEDRIFDLKRRVLMRDTEVIDRLMKAAGVQDEES